jgi:ribonuclease HI
MGITYTMALGKKAIISNHECEAYGVFLAATLLTQVVTAETQNALILIDNQGVISRMRNIASPKPGQYLFQFIMDTLNVLPQSLTVHFFWCPGHQEIAGNEKANEPAKAAFKRNENQKLTSLETARKPKA